LRVTNATELNQVAARLFTEETFREQAIHQYQKFISEYCIPDGSASERLFNEVELLSRTGGIV
jgi:hypothetical protein